jgi:cellulose biosynthesis protein BcsQ
VLSLKGGVGKTTTVLGLAGACARRGIRTLVIDLDPQANATTALDLGTIDLTSCEVLVAGTIAGLRSAITSSGWDATIDVVPSELALEHRNRPDRSAPSSDGSMRLRSALTGLTGYDLVLIDTPPSLGSLTRNALVAADLAVVVAEPTLFALHGARRALAAVLAVQDGNNPGVRTAGIVVNRVRPTSEHRFRIGELRLAYGPLVLEPTVPDRTVVQQAAGALVPLYRWRSPGAREVAAVFDQYLDRLLSEPMSWAIRTGSLRRGDTAVDIEARNYIPRHAERVS